MRDGGENVIAFGPRPPRLGGRRASLHAGAVVPRGSSPWRAAALSVARLSLYFPAGADHRKAAATPPLRRIKIQYSVFCPSIFIRDSV